jgi:hypothetical protein
LDVFRWQAWALDKYEPRIEVWVEDDVEGGGWWVDGVPRQRVLNESGNDAFILVAYEWENETYEQDFSPDQIRKRGATITAREEYHNFVEKQRTTGSRAGANNMTISHPSVSRASFGDNF